MADISNVKMGVCSVKYNGVDLGHTKGGVTVTYTPEIKDITVDKYGTTPARKHIIGQSLKALCPLAEATIANLAIAVPAGDSDASAVKIGGQVGGELTGAELVLHPIANLANDLSEDVVIYKAVPVNPIGVPFMVDNERVIEVEFDGVIDESRADGDQLGMFGDSTA